MFYCLQCSIDHLEFSRVLCNRLSWFFRCHPYAPCWPLNASKPTPTPALVQVSSCQEWYTAGQHDMWSACGSGWCLVRCTPSPPHPLVEASSGQEQYYIWSAIGSGWPVYSTVNLVPAARVIPAPWADIKVVAVKKLVCYCLQFSFAIVCSFQ